MALVFAPDGTPGEVPDEQYEAALRAGYKPREDKKAARDAAAADSPVRAGVEALARGLPIVGPVVTKVAQDVEALVRGVPNADVAREMEARRDQNPVASTIGNIAGFAAPLGIAGKGVSTAAKLAGFAAEGSIAGISNAFSDAAIEDVPLTAEKVAADAIGGGLGGLLGGGLLMGVQKLVSPTVKRFGGEVVKDVVNAAVPEKNIFNSRTAAIKQVEGSYDEILDGLKANKSSAKGTVNARAARAAPEPINPPSSNPTTSPPPEIPAGAMAPKGSALADMLEKYGEKVPAGAVGGVVGGLEEGIRTDWAPGAVAMGALGGAAIGKNLPLAGAAKFGAKLLRGDTGAVSNVASALSKRIMPVLETAPQSLGVFKAPLEYAVMRGGEELLRTHGMLAASPQGEQYLAALGLQNEGPAEIAVLSNKLAQLDAIEAVSDKFDNKMAASENALFNAKRGRPGRVAVPDPKSFNKQMAHIKELLADPEAAYAQIPPELQNALPGTATQVVTTILNGAKFLDQKAPKNPQSSLPAAIQAPWKPSAAELDRWFRYHEAVSHPNKVMEKMAQGFISPEYKEALQAVYPRFYEDFKAKIAERLMQSQAKIPYKQRLALQALLGPNVTGMTPQRLAIMQMSHQPPQAGQAKGPDGRQTVDAQKNAETQAQRLEGR